MGCRPCNGGAFWVCDPDQSTPECDWQLSNGRRVVGLYHLIAGDHDVWCKTGCDATIGPTQPPGSWHKAGTVTIGAGDDGYYEVSCRPSPHGKCGVKLEKVG